MAVRSRFRALILPVALYGACGAASAYFMWHSFNGQRGLKARAEYMERLAGLERENKALVQERAQWMRKIELLKGESIDKDLLDEQARIKLGRIHKNELVILNLPKAYSE